MRYPEYPTMLEDMPVGRPFEMYNYEGRFMRVKCGGYLLVTFPHAYDPGPRPFDGNKYHLPVVELSTGKLFYMSCKKPCRRAWPTR